MYPFQSNYRDRSTVMKPTVITTNLETYRYLIELVLTWLTKGANSGQCREYSHLHLVPGRVRVHLARGGTARVEGVQVMQQYWPQLILNCLLL